MRTGWIRIGKKRYYFKKNGKPKKGWLKKNGSYYTKESHVKFPQVQKYQEVDERNGKFLKNMNYMVAYATERMENKAVRLQFVNLCAVLKVGFKAGTTKTFLDGNGNNAGIRKIVLLNRIPRLKLVPLGAQEARGTRGVAVKCIDITKNADCEGSVLGCNRRSCSKARVSNRIRYPGSPRSKRWMPAVWGIPLRRQAKALSIPPGEYAGNGETQRN